jgi:hypothetical protein
VKLGFIVSFLASAACYAMLSQATTLEILYLSKIPTLLQAGFLCAQVAASQATNDGADRVTALGRLTMSYTIGRSLNNFLCGCLVNSALIYSQGSVIGPMLGGFLGASGDYYFGAKLAVGGSLLSVFLTLLMPDSKETVTPQKVDVKNAGDKVPSILEVATLVWLFLATKTITSVANAMAQAAFPLILKDIYHMREAALGITMSVMSAYNGFINGFLLGPALNLLGGNALALIGYCILTMCILSAVQAVFGLPSIAVMTFGDGMYAFIGLSFLLSMAQYVLATTITSESTTRVDANAKGTLIGLEHALFSGARVFAPQVGVLLLTSGGVTAVSGACAAVFFTVYMTWTSLEDNYKRVSTDDTDKSVVGDNISTSCCFVSNSDNDERKDK